MKHVFVSHASADAATAGDLCGRLEKQGLQCWIAPRDIPAGASYGEEILRGIQEADALLLVLTAASHASPHVLKELERAVHYGVQVVAARFDGVVPDGSMEYFLSSYQWLDCHGLDLDEVVRRLSFVLAEEDAPGQPQPAPTGEGAVASINRLPMPPIPFVGRSFEFRRLSTWWDKAEESGRSVFVDGEQGAGKKALAIAFANRVRSEDPQALVVVSACTSASAPLAPFADLLAAALDSNRADMTRPFQDLARGLGWASPSLGSPLSSDTIPQMMSTPRSASNLAETSHQMWLFLQRAAQGRRFLWCLLDAHRLDEGTLSSIGYFCERTASSTGMILLTHPDSAEDQNLAPLLRLQRDLAPTRTLERLHLAGLDADEIGQLVVDKFGTIASLGVLSSRLRAHTSGNPLFLVELLEYAQELADETEASAALVLADDAFWTNVPDSVGLLLESRLASLDERVRTVLEVAALGGSEFSGDVVARVARVISPDEEDVRSCLDALQKRHAMIEPVDELPDGRLARYRFTCELMRSYVLAAGSTLSSAERVNVFEKMAQCYEDLHKEGCIPDVTLIADAYEHAGRLLDAARWYATAARLAAERLELEAADLFAERAVSIIAPIGAENPNEYAEQLLGAAEIDYLLGQSEEARGKALLVLQHAVPLDVRSRAAAEEILARLDFRSGAYVQAAERFQRVKESYEQAGADEGVCRALGREAACYEKAGDLERAMTAYRKELSTARIWGDSLAMTRAYKHLASASYETGEFDIAAELVEKARDSLRDTPDALEEARLGLLAGNIALAAHRYSDAEELLGPSLSTFESMGYRSNVLRTLHALGTALLWQNRLREAEECARRALCETCEQDPVERSKLLKLMGQILMRQGDYPEAESTLRESLAIDERHALSVASAESHFLLGSMWALEGSQKRALGEYAEALNVYEELCDEVELAHVCARIGSVKRKLGDLDEAESWYNRAMRTAKRSGNSFAIGRASRGLGKTALARQDNDLAEDFLMRGLEVMRTHAGPLEVAGVLEPLGRALEAQGRSGEARAAYEEALALVDAEFNSDLSDTLRQAIARVS